MNRVLIIVENSATGAALADIIDRSGVQIIRAQGGAEGLQRLRAERFDLYYFSLKLPDMSVRDLVREVLRLRLHMPGIVICEPSQRAEAQALMWEGVHEYALYPFDRDETVLKLNRALDVSALRESQQSLQQQLRRHFEYSMLNGTSAAIRKMKHDVEAIADTETPVLITGEPGSGKTQIARIIHFNSVRSTRHFVSANCSVLQEDLLETRFFGLEAGTFKSGYVEQATGGTLFLEEINALPLALQERLLDMLTSGTYRRVGGVERLSANVRLLCASHTDLQRAAEAGAFNRDLFERISAVHLEVVPLRKRRDDIPLLVQHFAGTFAGEIGNPAPRFSREAMNMMLRYHWPGNVLQLQRIVEGLVVSVSAATIEPEDLPQEIQHPQGGSENSREECMDFSLMNLPQEGIHLKDMVEQLERLMITQALQRAEGVKSRAASLLGMNRTTLIEKLKRLKL